MKVLVLLSLAVFCYSTEITTDRLITVREDDTITIVSTRGREVDILKNIINPRKIDMVLKSPFGLVRKIEVEEVNFINYRLLNSINFFRTQMYFGRQKDLITQIDILAHLVRQYEGIVDETTYLDMLEKIEYLVNAGMVHQTVIDVLRNLDQLYLIEVIKMGQLDASEMIPTIMNRDGVNPLEKQNELLHRNSEMVPVEEVLNKYLRTLYPTQFNTANNDFWNIDKLTPVERLILFQYLEQQSLKREELPGKYMFNNQYYIPEYLKKPLMKPQMINEPQMHEQTDMDRFMYNMNLLKQNQGFEYPTHTTQLPQFEVQKLILKLIQKRGQQQLTPEQIIPRQWTQDHLIPQEMNQQEINPQMRTVIPEMTLNQKLFNQQVASQQLSDQSLSQWLQSERFNQQPVGQNNAYEGLQRYQTKNKQIQGLERLVEQGQVLPQELNMLQQYQRMMPVY